MMVETEKVYVTWEEFDKLIIKLADDIKAFKVKDKSLAEAIFIIVTKPRGGFPVATALSHALGITNVHQYLPSVVDYSAHNDVIHLIVDDIADSGETLFDMVHNIGLKNTYVAVLHYKKDRSRIRPDFYGKTIEMNHWIVYPWETDESTDTGAEKRIVPSIHRDIEEDLIKEKEEADEPQVNDDDF